MTDHDSLAQPSPFRTVPSVATGGTAAVAIPWLGRYLAENERGIVNPHGNRRDREPMSDRGPDDAAIAAIRRYLYVSTTEGRQELYNKMYDDIQTLLRALDALTAERDDYRDRLETTYRAAEATRTRLEGELSAALSDNAALLAFIRDGLSVLLDVNAGDLPEAKAREIVTWIGDCDSILEVDHPGAAPLGVVEAAVVREKAYKAMEADGLTTMRQINEQHPGMLSDVPSALAYLAAESALAAAIARLPR